MTKLKILTASAAGVWLITVVMIIIFPRQQHPALSTVLAILFWLTIIITGLLTYSLISGVIRQKRRRRNRQISSQQLNSNETEDQSRQLKQQM